MLRHHDILLIADEVVTGFGRLGAMFGSDHYGIEPDIITIAKGLTSAYAPLSGSIVGDKVWKVLEQGTDEYGAIGHGWTYSAHPIGAAAGIANLSSSTAGPRRERRRDRRLPPAALTDALAAHPGNVGDIRGEGMLAAIEFVEDRDAAASSTRTARSGRPSPRRCSPRGVIARAMPQGDILAAPLYDARGGRRIVSLRLGDGRHLGEESGSADSRPRIAPGPPRRGPSSPLPPGGVGAQVGFSRSRPK